MAEFSLQNRKKLITDFTGGIFDASTNNTEDSITLYCLNKSHMYFHCQYFQLENVNRDEHVYCCCCNDIILTKDLKKSMKAIQKIYSSSKKAKEMIVLFLKNIGFMEVKEEKNELNFVDFSGHSFLPTGKSETFSKASLNNFIFVKIKAISSLDCYVNYSKKMSNSGFFAHLQTIYQTVNKEIFVGNNSTGLMGKIKNTVEYNTINPHILFRQCFVTGFTENFEIKSSV